MKRFIFSHYKKSIDQIKKFYENIILTNDYRKFKNPVDEPIMRSKNEAFSYIIFDKESNIIL